MKTIKTIKYLSFAALLLAVGCNEEYVEREGTITTEEYVSLSVNELHFPVEGDAQTSKVFTDNDWVISGMPVWLTSEMTGGRGSAEFKMTAERNSAFLSRHAILTYKSAGFYEEFQHVYQDGEEEYHGFSGLDNESTIDSSPSGQEHTFIINTNISVEDMIITKTVESESWYDVSIDTNGPKLVVRTMPNTNGIARTSNWIYVEYRVAESSSGEKPATVRLLAFRIRQQEAAITPNTQQISVPIEGGKYKIRIESDIKWYAQVEYAQESWISVDDTPHAGTAEINMEVMPNQATASRNANVYIHPYGGNGEILAKIMISQTSLELSLSDPSADIKADGSNSAVVNVYSNSDWTVSRISQAWLKAEPKSGSKNGRVTFTAEPNPGFKSRSAIVDICINGTSVTRTVTIAQLPKEKDIDTKKIAFDWMAAAYNVHFELDGQWEISQSDDKWLHITPLRGDGSATIKVSVDKNEGKNARSATIWINKGGVREFSIDVTQKGQYFEVPTAATVYADGGKIEVSVTTSTGSKVEMWNSASDHSAPDWASIEKVDENRYVISVLVNQSLKRRTAIAAFTPTYTGVNDEYKRGTLFNLIQEGRRLSSDDVKSIDATKAGGSFGPFTLTVDGKFTVGKSANWFTLKQDGKSFTVEVMENKSSQRTAAITASLIGLPAGEDSMMIIIPVNQNGPGANIEVGGYGDDEDWTIKTLKIK